MIYAIIIIGEIVKTNAFSQIDNAHPHQIDCAGIPAMLYENK